MLKNESKQKNLGEIHIARVKLYTLTGVRIIERRVLENLFGIW